MLLNFMLTLKLVNFGRRKKKVKNIMKLIVLVMLIMIMNNVNVFHPLRGVYTMNLVNLENV
ncbi:MAG: hypothetical protein DBX97_23255 [Collinsella tanakaei]|nr:MAG: hypothetical protein DBX97_23255 [Collinsella tanakaei]